MIKSVNYLTIETKKLIYECNKEYCVKIILFNELSNMEGLTKLYVKLRQTEEKCDTHFSKYRQIYSRYK